MAYISTRSIGPYLTNIFCPEIFLFGLWFYIPVNSYGHVEVVNHHLKMLSVTCIYSNALQNKFTMRLNTIKPDQTAPKEWSDLSFYCCNKGYQSTQADVLKMSPAAYIQTHSRILLPWEQTL